MQVDQLLRLQRNLLLGSPTLCLPSSNALPIPGRETDVPRHIEKAFEYALKIKADTRLDTEDYNILTYRPGTLFNEETMLTHPGSGV
jgi:hypothetical protein